MRASAALLLLEQAALRRQELLARDELKRRFLGRDADRGADRADVRVAVQDVLRLEGFLSRPAALLPDTGYGLPQFEERKMLTQESNRQAAQWRQQHDWLRSEARKMLPPQTAGCARCDRSQCRCAGRAVKAAASGTRRCGALKSAVPTGIGGQFLLHFGQAAVLVNKGLQGESL